MSNEEKLKKAYEDVVWMAIRYAHGRKTYAPSMVRNSISLFKEVFPDWSPQADPVVTREKWDGVGVLNRADDFLDDLVPEVKS